MERISEKFQFATAARIVFGTDASERLGVELNALGTRAYVLTGATPARVLPVLGQAGEAVDICAEDIVEGEPTVASVQALADNARASECDLVVGIGGGSVIDAAKAVACLVTNTGDVLDYLEVIGAGRPLEQPGVPCVAIPTTAGTGAEVTRNAVVRSDAEQVKVSLRSPHMLPKLALVDPVLTYSAPPQLTADAGLDALTQLIEAFVSRQANVLTDAICRAGIPRARALPDAVTDGGNVAARESMALASLFSGLALANAKLGAVHGFAGPLGGRLGLPHGAVCARLLPFVMEANLAALDSSLDSAVREKYTELARILCARGSADARDGVAWVRRLCESLNVRALQCELSDQEREVLVQQARRSSSMKGNPVDLPDETLHAILARAAHPGW